VEPLVGRCFEQHAAVPFFPFTEALDAAAARLAPPVRTSLLEDRPALRAILPELIGPPRPIGEDDAPRVLRDAEALLRAVADAGPLVLLMEDLHWADSASLNLLLHLGRHLDGWRLVLIGTYRDVDVGPDHALETILRELRRERGMHELTLLGLTQDGVRELIRSRTGLEHVSPASADFIQRRTSGNAFYVGELVKALSYRGMLGELGGASGWDDARWQVPSTVRSVVRECVGRLPGPTQSLLELASLLGHEFDSPALAELAGEPETSVLRDLESALVARVLEARPHRAPDRFGFVQVLIQQAL
jgi:predicted ATPase